MTDPILPPPSTTSTPDESAESADSADAATPDETAEAATPDVTAETAPSPGERRLAHPPSDRYRVAEARAAAAADTADPAASLARGVAVATVVVILGAVAIVLLGGVLTITTGLLVVAGATGWGIAAALRIGAGEHLSSRRRVALAVALGAGAVALGQLGLWQYARTEGGVLPPLEYLGEVFGLLVPLEFAAAVVVAWLVAR